MDLSSNNKNQLIASTEAWDKHGQRQLHVQRQRVVFERPYVNSMTELFTLVGNVRSTTDHSIKRFKGTPLHNKTKPTVVKVVGVSKSYGEKITVHKPNNSKSKKHAKKTLVPKMLVSLALALFITGSLVVFKTFKTNQAVEAQVKGLSTHVKNDENAPPSEQGLPPNTSSYKVAPDMPRVLLIDKLKIDARVVPLGLTRDNVLKAPQNIYDVGWYQASAKPGQNGTIVMDGHRSGPSKPGVFKNLGKLEAGDKIQLERGDGKKFSYTVVKTENVKASELDMAKVLVSSVPGKPGLNLITCSGRFSAQTNQFDDRQVIYTVKDK